jgi:hypothetical protein
MLFELELSTVWHIAEQGNLNLLPLSRSMGQLIA